MNTLSYCSIYPNLFLHKYGKQSMIVDDQGVEYLYTEPQTDILSLCDGTKTVLQIIDELVIQYGAENDPRIESFKKSIESFIEYQIKHKVVMLSDRIVNVNNIYGIRNKFYPNALSVEITSRCNFMCPHCYKNASYLGKDIDEKVIIYIIQTFGEKVKQLQLTGGEPFANPNIDRYIHMLSDHFEIRIPTNGSLLYKYNDSTISKLSYVQFSLYGANSEEYEKFTRNKDAFFSLEKSIEKVNHCGVDNVLSLVLNKNNIHRMEEFVVCALKLGGKRIKFGVPSIAGRACDDMESEKKFLLSDNDLRYAYRESRNLKTKYAGKISVGIWSHRSQEPKKPLFSGALYDKMPPCGAGYMSYVISQDGRIRPCELLPEDIFDLGNYTKLSEYIDGNFFSDYDKMLCELQSRVCKYGLGLDCICTPIKSLYERIARD